MPGREVAESATTPDGRRPTDRRPGRDTGFRRAGPAPGAMAARPQVLVMFEANDVCFLRINLEPGEAGDPVISRGAQGRVVQAGCSDFTVKVYFPVADKFVRCKPQWLEAWPGEVVQGICRMWATQPNPMYSTGMMVSDLRFPVESDPCYERFCENRRSLMRSGLGFSFYDRVDATNARWTLEHAYRHGPAVLERIGVILCEEIWPLDRRQWPRACDFHACVVRSLMGQWTAATCVVVLRDFDARRLARELGDVKRITYHYDESFLLHYTPLTMGRQEPACSVDGVAWCAVVVHPKVGPRLLGPGQRVFIPELVLKGMFAEQCTLQLCAYTCESSLACMEYLLDIKRLHRLHRE